MNKLLIINRNFYGTSVIYETDFYEDLKKEFDLFFYGENQINNIKNNSLEKVISENNIDYILCMHNNDTIYYKEFFNLNFEKKFIILGDLHDNWLGKTKKEIKENINKFNLKGVFIKSVYNTYNFDIDGFYFLPWSLNEKTYSFNNQKVRKYDICFMGQYQKNIYPLRYEVFKSLNSKKYSDYQILFSKRTRKAKYDNNFLNSYASETKKEKVGIEYVEILKNSKIMIFDSSIYKYPVKKYFECMATGCLILADKPNLSKEIGLVEGFNFININRTNWEKKLSFYLKNDEERIRIIENARNTFLKKHTNKIRIDFLKKIITSL